MVWLLAAGVLIALLGLTQAVPDSEFHLVDDKLLTTDLRTLQQEDDDVPGLRKRDLEFNQYVPAYRLRGEPSCEELRAMWRLSKREARRATSTNNIPRSRPYSYGRLIAFAPSPHSRPFIYGEPRNFAHNTVSFSPVKGSFNRLRGIMGGGAGRPGSLQRVRGMVDTQRLPGESSKGKYDELRGLVLDANRPKTSQEEEIEVEPSLRSSDMYQPVRRASLSVLYEQQRQSQVPSEGFTGPLMPGNSVVSSLPSEWRAQRPWNSRENSCVEVEGKSCQINSECACAGQFRCSKGRCKVFSIHPEIEDELGTWFSGALNREELGLLDKEGRWNR